MRLTRNDARPDLFLEHLAVDDLKVTRNRVRNHGVEQLRAIRQSISALGFCAPILVGNENEVIDGEARLAAARELGLRDVPCIRVSHLNGSERRALRLAINRLGERAEWDLSALRIEFEELIELEIPTIITGFSGEEIDQIIVLDETDQAVEKGKLEPEEGAQAIAKLGDVFQLGPHRLICGDATDPAVIAKLMGTQPAGSARLIFTDVPYNVPIKGHVSSGKHREFAMASGEMTAAEFLAFNRAWISAALPHLSDGGLLGTFIDWRGQLTLHEAAKSHDLEQLNLIVWAKTNAGMGSHYRSQHELLPLYKKGKAPHVNNIKLGKNGRYRSNLWTYPGASSLGSDARRGLQDHPTVKPVAMLHDALLDITDRGDLVIDPFLGSGSTLMAAHKTGRICFGIELDPLYVDVIIRRYEASTGDHAINVQTGLRSDVEAGQAAG